MPNSDDFLVVAKTLVAKDQNSCSGMAVHEGDMVRLDEFLYLYCLRESKRFGYYEFSPWEKKTRLVVDLPLSFRDWKS